jgi:putative oxidoreductase
MAPYGAALLRVMLGVIYVMHGYLALFVSRPDAVASMIGRHVSPIAPTVLAWYLIGAHLLGGVLLILGLYTRWAALANVPIMAGAVFGIHAAQGFFMKGSILDAVAGRAGVAGYEFALLMLVATMAQALLGGGALAVTRD